MALAEDAAVAVGQQRISPSFEGLAGIHRLIPQLVFQLAGGDELGDE